MDTPKIKRFVIHADYKTYFDNQLNDFLKAGWRVTPQTFQAQLREPAKGETPAKISYFVQVEVEVTEK